MEKIKAFYALADEYCSFLVKQVITTDTVPVLMEHLMKLYISAMNLPDPEPDTVESTGSDYAPIRAIRSDRQIPTLYWEIFDPTVEEEPVCGNLIDDLAEIAADLRNGMAEYEAGKFGNACFEWKIGLDSHWGNHAVDALRVLHFIRSG